jgi:hypothetical protein
MAVIVVAKETVMSQTARLMLAALLATAVDSGAMAESDHPPPVPAPKDGKAHAL